MNPIKVRHSPESENAIPEHVVFIDSNELISLFGASGVSGLISNPPSGMHRVTNLYVNPEGKLVVKWDDVPT
jgi:hypothetical protein